MKITKELNCISDFDFWGGALDTINHLTSDQMDRLDSILEAEYPDGIDETELNDLFAHDDNTLAQFLGFSDFQELVRANDAEEDEEDDDDI